MTYAYRDDKPATFDSPIHVADALRVVELGQRVLKCFDQYGVKTHSSTSKAFDAFVKALCGSGFVVADFDGPLFDRGPMHFLFAPALSALVIANSNLTTIRMFVHTLCRGHRGTDGGEGYPYFDRAYRSGGLRALIERLANDCQVARERGSSVLIDSTTLLIREVPF